MLASWPVASMPFFCTSAAGPSRGLYSSARLVGMRRRAHRRQASMVGGVLGTLAQPCHAGGCAAEPTLHSPASLAAREFADRAAGQSLPCGSWSSCIRRGSAGSASCPSRWPPLPPRGSGSPGTCTQAAGEASLFTAAARTAGVQPRPCRWQQAGQLTLLKLCYLGAGAAAQRRAAHMSGHATVQDGAAGW